MTELRQSRSVARASRWLAGSLGVLALLYPILDRGIAGLAIWTAVFWAALYSVVRIAACRRRSYFRACRLFFALATSSTLVAVVCYGIRDDGHGWIFVILNGLTLCFLALSCWVLLDDLFEANDVGRDHVLGAVCLYVLIGLAWTYVYHVLHGLSLAPTLSASASASDAAARHSEYLYFSFVTLSTLGYGDITPKTSVLRVAAISEVILGQVFLAVLVARVVGLHLVQRTIVRHARGSRTSGS